MRGQLFEVTEDGGTIGSRETNTIGIQDEQKSVSRSHGRILYMQVGIDGW